MAERTCAGCTTTITPHPRERNPKVWCTDACRARWKRANDPTYMARERARKAAKVYAQFTDHQRVARRKLRNAERGTRAGYTLVMGWCEACDHPFTSRRSGESPRYCTPTCKAKAKAQRFRASGGKAEAKQRRRARKRASFVAPVNRRAIYERDRWTCQLCGQRLERNTVAPHPLAPTIDHIVPLAKGGTHEPANVQAAHFLCNSRKGDRATDDQLRLIG